MQPIYIPISKLDPRSESVKSQPTPEPETPKTAIPGLDIPPPKPNQNSQFFQNMAQTADILQTWKNNATAFLHNHLDKLPNQNASNAVPDAIAFNKNQLQHALDSLPANNPNAAAYLRLEGSRIASQNIARAQARANLKTQAHVESALHNEEQSARDTMLDPLSSQSARTQDFNNYALKMQSWMASQGKSPEDFKAWKAEKRRSFAADGLKARFDRLLENDPAQALRLARLANGQPEKKQSGTVENSTLTEGIASAEGITLTDAITTPASTDGTTSTDTNTPASEDPDAPAFRSVASELASTLTPEDRRLMLGRAEAKCAERLALRKEVANSHNASLTTSFLTAAQTGDYTALHNAEQDFTTIGHHAEAQLIANERKSLEFAKPYLDASRFHPFTQQHEIMNKAFPDAETPTPANTSLANDTTNDTSLAATTTNNTALTQPPTRKPPARTAANRILAARESDFRRDPAGYVAEHPMISANGTPAKDFLAQEGISAEGNITRSLNLQRHIGKGTNILPRILTETRATTLKNQYDTLADPAKKLEILRELLSECGKYASMAAAEAGLPAGVSSLAHILPGLPDSEAAKLAQAAEMRLDDMNGLPDDRKEAIRKSVESSPMVRALAAAGAGLSGDAGEEITRALESFVALGGNLKRLEGRVALAGLDLAREVAEAAGSANGAGEGDGAEYDEGDGTATPLRLALRGLGIAAGGESGGEVIGEGGTNGLIPVSDGGADDSAPTPAQTLLHTLNKGGPEASFAAWGANALLTQTAADGLPGEYASLLETFRNGEPAPIEPAATATQGNEYFPGTKLSKEAMRQTWQHDQDFYALLKAAPEPSLEDSFKDGLQDSVIALAIYGKEPDALTPEQRASLPFLHRMTRALGTFTGDAPVYAAGGLIGSAGGPIGAGAGALGLKEGLRAVYLDKIRKGEVKDLDDFMERALHASTATVEGSLAGAGMAAGGIGGGVMASRLGFGAARAVGTYAGQLTGLTAVTAALREEMPSAQDFMDNAALILGLNAGAKLAGTAGARVQTLKDTLVAINEKTGISPKVVAEDVRTNPEYARSVREEPGAKTYVFAKTVESAAKRMGAENPLSYLRQTQVDVVEVTPRFEGRDIKDIRETESSRMKSELPTDITNKQTGETMFLSKGGIKHSINSATRPGEQRLTGVSREHMEVLEHTHELLENAVLGEVHANKVEGVTYPVSRYYSVARINNELFVVKITAIKEPGKSVSKAEIESIERVYDAYITKKMPGSVMEVPHALAKPSGIEQPTPGITHNISASPQPVNGGISLFNILDGLKDSADKKTPLHRPVDPQ